MRIAYLINTYPMTSQTFIRREIAALEGLGFQVRRFAHRPWSSPLVEDRDRREHEQTRYLQLAGLVAIGGAVSAKLCASPVRFTKGLALALRCRRRSDRSTLRHLAYFAQACVLSRWLEADQVEHLHAHFGTNSADVAMLCRALGGPTYSFTVHGPEAIERAASLNYPDKVGRAAFVAAITEYTRAQLRDRVDGALWPRIEIVHCGLDPSFLEHEPAPLPDAPRLVCVGRLCERKGQRELVEAAAQLHARGVAFELVLVGGGELEAELRSRVQAAGLGDRVRFLGWSDTPAVRRAIEDARALVLPSFAEGLPVVIMEALALGRPVISTQIAGIPELVDDACGWLVPAGSVDALRDALQKALECDRQTAAAMGAEGRRRVLEGHDTAVEAAKLAAFIRARVG